MVIYVDELFLENFIMNYIILFITSYFSKIKSKWYRLGISATIGAIYVIFTYVANISIYNNLIFKTILSILMIVIAFNLKRFTEFLKAICIFYLVTFAIGGAGFCIGYFSDAVTISETGVIYVKEISLKIVIISMLVTFIIAKILILLLKNRIEMSEQYFKMDIVLGENIINVNAFLDTGNTIHEPYSKKSVIFVEAYELKEFLPEYLYKILLRNDGIENIVDEFWGRKIILLPISTVNEKNQLRIGIRTDKVLIATEGGTIEKNGVVVVLCEKISKDGSYSALIGKDLISI